MPQLIKFVYIDVLRIYRSVDLYVIEQTKVMGNRKSIGKRL